MMPKIVEPVNELRAIECAGDVCMSTAGTDRLIALRRMTIFRPPYRFHGSCKRYQAAIPNVRSALRSHRINTIYEHPLIFTVTLVQFKLDFRPPMTDIYPNVIKALILWQKILPSQPLHLNELRKNPQHPLPVKLPQLSPHHLSLLKRAIGREGE